MINELFFMGLPISFQNLCEVYPPTVKEARFNKEFPYYRQLLTVSQEELEDKWDEEGIEGDPPSPFLYLMTFSKGDSQREKLACRAFEFFIHEPVTFMHDIDSICIGDIEQEILKIKDPRELRFITEENYFEFQNLCREAIGEKAVEPYEINLNPKIRRFKKLARKREKIASKQKGIDFGTSLAAICCMGVGLSPLNVGEISICAMYALIGLYQNKEKYDIDIRSLQAGADAKKIKPEYWIKN